MFGRGRRTQLEPSAKAVARESARIHQIERDYEQARRAKASYVAGDIGIEELVVGWWESIKYEPIAPLSAAIARLLSEMVALEHERQRAAA